jgi:hypothetical protein
MTEGEPVDQHQVGSFHGRESFAWARDDEALRRWVSRFRVVFKEAAHRDRSTEASTATDENVLRGLEDGRRSADGVSPAEGTGGTGRDTDGDSTIGEAG